MSEEALREIEKLRIRLSGLKRAEDEARVSLGVCLDKWQKLIERLSKDDTPSQEDVLRLRLEAHEALEEALEKESKLEHERSHLAESLGRLLLDVERGFQDYLRRSKEP